MKTAVLIFTLLLKCVKSRRFLFINRKLKYLEYPNVWHHHMQYLVKPSSKLFYLMQELTCHQQLYFWEFYRTHFLIFLVFCHLLQTVTIITFVCSFCSTALFFILFPHSLSKKRNIELLLRYTEKRRLDFFSAWITLYPQHQVLSAYWNQRFICSISNS